MARIDDIPQPTRDTILAAVCPAPDGTPWVQTKPLSNSRIAILTSAALHPRVQMPFPAGSAEFRELPADLAQSDILMSHISINFDRVGFQRDINIVYPIDRLRELAREGVIGSVADTHYSVMGSTDPATMTATADALATRFEQDKVDAVVFSPV